MDASKLQQVIDAENERLNEISMQKAAARLREIHALVKERESVNKRIDESIKRLQTEINDLPWDSVTAADIIGTSTTE